MSQLTIAQSEGDTIAYKGAGELAEAADVGIYLKRSNTDKARILVQIKKNRHGPLGEGVMEYTNNWTSLVEVDS